MKNENKTNYEANGKPYLVMSEKSNFGKKLNIIMDCMM